MEKAAPQSDDELVAEAALDQTVHPQKVIRSQQSLNFEDVNDRNRTISINIGLPIDDIQQIQSISLQKLFELLHTLFPNQSLKEVDEGPDFLYVLYGLAGEAVGQARTLLGKPRWSDDEDNAVFLALEKLNYSKKPDTTPPSSLDPQ